MRNAPRQMFCLTAIAAAIAGTCMPAWAADDDELKSLTTPQSTLQVGLGVSSADGPRFGQFNGLNRKGSYGLIDGEMVRRDDETGTWLRVRGTDLGLDSRRLSFEHGRQGHWGYQLEYDETPRFTPYTVNTGLSGIGTAAQTVNGTARRDVDLETRRDVMTLGYNRILSGHFDIQVRFRNENKEGGRPWGQGTPLNFLVDPIDQHTQQFDVILGYRSDKLQLSGGYYGTIFDNRNRYASILGSTLGQMALPPGSQSHQLYLSGSYAISASTRANFKAAYSRVTQDEPFMAAPDLKISNMLANTRSDLGGRVQPTLLQMGLTSRPLPKLSVLANVRYEDRDDRTVIAPYVAAGTNTDGNNEPRSIRTLASKFEASYSLPQGYRLVGGVDHEDKKRNTSPIRIVGYRETTRETTYRGELRRSISETVTGGVGYHYSERTGTDFQTSAASNLIAPIHLADRDRNKLRMTLNWQATDLLMMQFRVDQSHDNYGQRFGSTLGPQSGEVHTYAVDASLAWSERWQFSAWASRDDIRYQQRQRSLADPVLANLRTAGDAIGLGVRGKVVDRLEIGADLSVADITEENRQQALSGAAADLIPDVATKLTRTTLFANYAFNRSTTLRGFYVHDRYQSSDWAWNRWTYADGTTVNGQALQNVHFVGLMVRYRY